MLRDELVLKALNEGNKKELKGMAIELMATREDFSYGLDLELATEEEINVLFWGIEFKSFEGDMIEIQF